MLVLTKEKINSTSKEYNPSRFEKIRFSINWYVFVTEVDEMPSDCIAFAEVKPTMMQVVLSQTNDIKNVVFKKVKK